MRAYTRDRQGGRSMSTYSRRKFLKVAAATGLVVACAPAASPPASPSGAAPSQAKGLTGTITVSYPDELGVKPKYVDQAAQAVQTKNSGTTVKVDLQKISDDLYYPKLLLALQTAGLPADWMPTKLADVVTAAAAVKSKEANVLPYALYAGAAASDGARDHAFVPLVWAYGGDVVTSDGKWVGNSAAIRKALA